MLSGRKRLRVYGSMSELCEDEFLDKEIEKGEIVKRFRRIRKWYVTIPLMLSYSIPRRHLTAGVLVLRHLRLLLRHLWLLLRHLLEIISPFS